MMCKTLRTISYTRREIQLSYSPIRTYDVIRVSYVIDSRQSKISFIRVFAPRKEEKGKDTNAITRFPRPIICINFI